VLAITAWLTMVTTGSPTGEVPRPNHCVQGCKCLSETLECTAEADVLDGIPTLLDIGSMANITHILAQEKMLNHLHELMLDASDYPWTHVRNYHAILLNQFEMNRMTWDDTDRVQQLRHTYAHRSNSTPASGHVATKSSRNPSSGQALLYCAPYQKGSCTEADEHSTARGTTVRHVCAYCFRQTGSGYPHPEEKCRRKKFNTDRMAKNDSAEL
jgi:hypothetical protein